jgi:hypothetical protein
VAQAVGGPLREAVIVAFLPRVLRAEGCREFPAELVGITRLEALAVQDEIVTAIRITLW